MALPGSGLENSNEARLKLPYCYKIKKRSKIWFKKMVTLTRKKKFPKNERIAVDQAILTWFCKARNMNLPISGSTNQARGFKLAQCLGLSDFKASIVGYKDLVADTILDNMRKPSVILMYNM